MVKGKEKILQFIRDNDSPYWTLFHYEKGNGNTFLSRIEDESISLDVSIERLSKYLDLVEPGRYRLSAKRTFGTAKGYAETAIELLAENSAVAGANASTQFPGLPFAMNGETYVPAGDVAKQISSALAEYEAKQEAKRKDERIAEMERQIREYEKGDFSQTFGRIYTRFEPFIDQVVIPSLNKNLNVKPAISGANNIPMNGQNNTVDTDDEKEFAELLERWEKIHPGDPLAVVRAIVKMAETDPAKYVMAKQLM